MRLCPAHRSIIGATVSGTVDDTYLAAWLTRGDPSHPVQTAGDLSLTVTASLSVDVVAVTHHNIAAAATIALGGSLSSTIPTQSHGPDGIPGNWYRLFTTPIAVTSIVLGVTGNSGPVIVGELYAGLSTLFPALHLGRRLSPGAVFPWEGEFGLMAPYDAGVHRPLRVRGTMVLTEAQLNELDACYLSQQTGSRPVLIIPDYPVDTAWLCQFAYEASDFIPGESPAGSPVTPDHQQAWFAVTLEIVEIPRLRWP